MIKKFEEFVNEMYSQRRDYDREMVEYLSSIGVSDDDCKEIAKLLNVNGNLYINDKLSN